ncbi:BPSL0067 family protein [Telmatospirillum sp.]|uniref:BPSL0067 family protein n=1 Tax=Telmatospirillum sp. TaxID=2079197 RepID=UPI0028460E98|nr:BPSL0067 family protein [Telmatospirillum sp.]MDR3435139.1 BPSL0067 family protein [Telmatospirillum sp.]
MSHIYGKVDSLVTTPPKPNVGTGQCVALVEKYTDVRAPADHFWKPGGVVRGNTTIARGTAIATFVDGKYQSLKQGNHAAFYISQDSAGIWVVDQYVGSGGIRKRHLRFKGKKQDGSFIDPSNNGDAFSVIE